MTRTFATPTPTMIEHVRTLTGETPVMEAFLQHMHERESVWDVGAGYGLYTLFAAGRLRCGGTVRAFEPEPSIRRLLDRNITLNNLAQAVVLPFALGERDGTTGLFASASPNVGTSALVQRQDYPVAPTPVTVSLLRGDTVIARNMAPRPTALKIDVEGAEFAVLSGLANTLSLGIVHLVCCEVHPKLLPLHGSSAERVEELLRSLGFSVLLRQERGTEYHLVCRRVS